MKISRLAVITLLLAIATPAPAQDLEIPFGLRVGESAEVKNADLTVGFGEVIHDSRCPTMVMCVWEGDAELSLWAESPGFAIERFTLNTHPDGVRQVELFDYIVSIVKLDPYPVFPGSIDEGKYLVTLLVESAKRTPLEPGSMGMIKGRYDR